MKSPEITPDLYDYMVEHSTSRNELILDELRQVTLEKCDDDAVMQISKLQGYFLTFLVRTLGVRRALEIGTFTGYSSICIADGLGDSGELVCLDVSKEWTDIAKQFWERAGCQSKIDLRIGPALVSLQKLRSASSFDFVFIDAEKTEYIDYFENVLEMTRPGGVILFDNMFRDGRVLDASPDPGTATINQLNKLLASDERVETVLIPIADGLQVCRKR